MIIDTALDTKFRRMLDHAHYKKLLKLRAQAKRFVFDEDASHKLGRFSIQHTDLVCEYALDPPRLPFPQTYIEIDQIACIAGSDNPPLEGSAPRLGFLFTKEDSAVYSMAGDEVNAFVEPFILHKGPRGIGETDDTLGSYEMVKYVLMIGQTDAAVRGSANFIGSYELKLTNAEVPEKIMQAMLMEGAGVFKRAFTALMLLNERVQPKYRKVAASRQFIGSKLTAMPAHTVVTIDLDEDRIRRVYDGTAHGGMGMTHALHDVADHWVTLDAASQCQHNWEPYFSKKETQRDKRAGYAQPITRQSCTECGGRRTMRHIGERGDRSKPKVVKKYKVIASKEKGK